MRKFALAVLILGLKLLLAVSSLTLVAGILELGFRASRDQILSAKHQIRGEPMQRSGFYTRDPGLGWVPNAGQQVRGIELGWDGEATIPGTRQDAIVTTLDNGLRSNGGGRVLPERPVILGVGDSFTFGGRVSDNQTWPAGLERTLGVRVLNGGVPSYGIDQAVLRAEALVARHRPDLLIVSYINRDLDRATVRFRSRTSKPFFRVEDGALVLYNTPTPPDPEMDAFRRMLGYSHLADYVMKKVASGYWHEGAGYATDEDGAEIGCLLMDRLSAIERRHSVSVLVMLQQAHPGEQPSPDGDRVLECAAQRGLATLDLFPILTAVEQRDPEWYESLFFGHMSPVGNEFVATVLSTEVEKIDTLVVRHYMQACILHTYIGTRLLLPSHQFQSSE